MYFVCIDISKSCWSLRFECSGHVSEGFPKKVWIEGCVCVCRELYPVFPPDLFSIENPLTVEDMSPEERVLQLATGTLD